MKFGLLGNFSNWAKLEEGRETKEEIEDLKKEYINKKYRLNELKFHLHIGLEIEKRDQQIKTERFGDYNDKNDLKEKEQAYQTEYSKLFKEVQRLEERLKNFNVDIKELDTTVSTAPQPESIEDLFDGSIKF